MPLPPPPAPLPYLAVRPSLASNPVTFGTVRAAALAARQARQLRMRKQQNVLSVPSEQMRSATPTITQRAIPFHEKKKLNLHLNMNAVTKPEVPLMFSAPNVDTTRGNPTALAREEMPWEAMEDEAENGDTVGGNVRLTPTAKRPSTFRARRQSSVTLSLTSPDGAEFQEVAHDGPEQLGKLTKRVKRLGKGAGGVVFLSLYLPALKLVAVKEVVIYKEQERELVKHELHALHENLVPIDATPTASTPDEANTGSVWTQLRLKLTSMVKPAAPSSLTESDVCPYLVGFYGAYLLPAKCAISIVMEFMDMGSLQDLVDAHVSIPEPVLRHCAFCCMTALEHMHHHRMIHRDIKPANILINSQGEFKIADFGLAGTLSKSSSFFSEFEGTMMYMAPERIQGHAYSYGSDLWSMGVSLVYLATGAYPFAVDEGFFGLEEAIVNDPLPPMPNRFTPECRDFIKSLLRRDPAQRLTAAQALAHPFLHGYGASPSFRSFPVLWNKMPLGQGAVKSEDVATIAQLMADYTCRKQRRASRRHGGPASRASMHVGVAIDNVDPRALEKLAEACRTRVDELQSLYERSLSRP